jgi:hypothetical protein
MRDIYKLIILLLTLLFTSCGGGSSSSNFSPSGDNIEIQTKQSLIDSSQKKFYLEFSMKNNYTDGIVAELSNISLDINACTVAESKLTLQDNSIEFSEPLESHTIGLTATFAYPCLPTSYRVTANSSLNYDGTSTKGSYSSPAYPITIDGNLTFEDIQTIFEYDIKLEPVDDEPKINLDTKKRYKLTLVNSSSNKNVLAERVHNITIKSSDPSQLKLIDPNNHKENRGKAVSELSFGRQNEIDLYIQTYKSSGIANLDVSISYTNNRGEIYDIERRASLVILSGEPTAFSINDKGVEEKYDENKWFTQTFFISASDKYNNKINIPSKINVSAMADFRDKNGYGDRVLYGKFSDINGELIADSDSHIATFKANREIFQNINPDRDYLLLFGDATTSEALGKWDIDRYTPLKDTLNLTTAYYGENHSNLGFAIGHNYINEICSSESKEWELLIDSEDGTYQLDSEGKASVKLKFPGYMIGKKIALSVNFSGKEKRAGEVHFQTLYSLNGVKTPEKIEIDANTTTPTTMLHFFEVDTGTDDTLMVKNAKVSCQIKSDNLKIIKKENSKVETIDDCKTIYKEFAYWKLTLELIDLEKPGTLSFEKCQVSSFLDKF